MDADQNKANLRNKDFHTSLLIQNSYFDCLFRFFPQLRWSTTITCRGHAKFTCFIGLIIIIFCGVGCRVVILKSRWMKSNSFIPRKWISLSKLGKLLCRLFRSRKNLFYQFWYILARRFNLFLTIQETWWSIRERILLTRSSFCFKTLVKMCRQNPRRCSMATLSSSPPFLVSSLLVTIALNLSGFRVHTFHSSSLASRSNLAPFLSTTELKIPSSYSSSRVAVVCRVGCRMSDVVCPQI